jgi:hypothetical protein
LQKDVHQIAPRRWPIAEAGSAQQIEDKARCALPVASIGMVRTVLVSSIAALGAFAALVLSAQAPATSDDPYPFRAADPSASPRIAKLRRDIQDSGASAVERFWEEIREIGAPLIEPVSGDNPKPGSCRV